MQATVRLIEDEPNVEVQVQWKDAQFQFLRPKDEAVQRFLVRLGMKCGTHAEPSGGDKKRAKKEKKKPQAGGSSTFAQATATGMSIRLVDANGIPIDGSTTVVEALSQATHIDVDGEKLPVFVNPPAVKKLEAFGKVVAGCPIVASIQVDFCDSSTVCFQWMLGAAVAGAGEDAKPSCIGRGRVLIVPNSAAGRVLTLQAELQGTEEGGAKVRSTLKVGIVEEPPQGWPDARLVAFGRNAGAGKERGLRVVSWNMLAPPYARTVYARAVYPYCPPASLDFAYRQPLLGRELARLDGDVVMLQEVTSTTHRKFLVPCFGDEYYSRITMKASQVSDGCVTMLRRGRFEVLEKADFLFRRLLLSEPAFRTVVSELRAKWPDFIEGVLPNMTTVFQLTVAKHTLTGEVIVLANTHLFYHPFARHIRLLQIMCLLHQTSELREKYKGKGGTSDMACDLPRVLFCGDLNCTPDTAALELLLKGEVDSNHTDWECADQFKWRREDEDIEGDSDVDTEVRNPGTVAEQDRPESDAPPAMPRAEWQAGRGVALRNPLGPLTDAYSSTPLPFTNFVADFNGVLDYILIAGPMKVAQTLRGASKAELEEMGGLPCALYPSDHVAIAVDTELLESAAAENV